ncbi:hypothetical protein [Cryobacterium sp.]|uniref:hypothetical protein n=1 Tax=Cryobacterium sp. TaxID=1926290 RepID=UPI0026042453|nr:hypothetical protein [Cryobacterium sp.]
MRLVAAALQAVDAPPDRGDQILADAENVIVSVLFDDIVRMLLTPATLRDPEPHPEVSPRPARTVAPRVPEGQDRMRPEWARSPPTAAQG